MRGTRRSRLPQGGRLAGSRRQINLKLSALAVIAAAALLTGVSGATWLTDHHGTTTTHRHKPGPEWSPSGAAADDQVHLEHWRATVLLTAQRHQRHERMVRRRRERRQDWRQAQAAPVPALPVSAATPASLPASGGGTGTLSGQLGCGGLEALWEAAGGPAGDAVLAASVAMAESGGDQYAISPGGANVGYWQINVSHGALASTDAMVNARAAVQISSDGSDWTPWTTYTSGAYAGKC
jgi:hypothetical protein